MNIVHVQKRLSMKKRHKFQSFTFICATFVILKLIFYIDSTKKTFESTVQRYAKLI